MLLLIKPSIDLPHKFEAGTPNISGVIGFGAAIDYMNSIGFNNIEVYEKELLDYATEKLKKIDNIKIYGDINNKISVISFNIRNHHPSDIGSILDCMNCCQNRTTLYQQLWIILIFWNCRASFLFTQKR